jgi:CRISPR/Cas system CSM-associated protein Csm3 (group 7 of RAMP superfamily)
MSKYRDYGGRREEPAEKPYKLVPLPKEVERGRPHGHDRFYKGTLAGEIRGLIVAASHVHVGSGILELGERLPLPPTGGRNPELVKAMVRSGDVPIIPGSSLKGVIRSVVEAISPSCLCKTRARFNEIPQGLGECRRKDSLCVACRIFGAMGFQGNVRIGDAPLKPDAKGRHATRVESIPALYAPSPRRRAYFLHGRVAGRKFFMHGRRARGATPIEVCPEGSRFDFSLRFENLESEELGLLLIALGLSDKHPFRLKVGGAKPSCFGSIEVRVEELMASSSSAASYLEFDEPGSDSYTGESLREYIKAAADMTLTSRKVVLEDQLIRLREILKYPNDRECPQGLY